MGINLQKGQKIDLTKGNAGLNELLVGLGWDAAAPSGGLFKRTVSIDCDASVFMLNEGDKLKNNGDIVYFGNLNHASNSVKHMGDNLTGDGNGDDEQILVHLKSIPQEIGKLVFVVNMYDCVKRKQHFGMVKNAYIRIVDKGNGQELLKFNLSDDYSDKTALIVGEVYRHSGEWKFNAVGEGTTDPGLSEMRNRYL